MTKRNKVNIIITTIIMLLPMLVGLILWDKLPDSIATRFGVEGEAVGWSSKEFVVFLMPLIMLGMQAFGLLATFIDPKKSNVSNKIFGMVLWICPVMSSLVHGIIYATALGVDLNVGRIIGAFMGLLFTIIGNYLPKCRQNYAIGIKISWTLENEGNWNSTHRLAGWIWMVCGIIIVILAFVLPMKLFFITFMGMVLLMIVIPLIHSYCYYRKHEKVE